MKAHHDGAANDARTQGLPPSLLLVPGGNVQIGLTAPDLVRVACEAVSPEKPQAAPKLGAAPLKTAIARGSRMLGQQRVAVDTFLLAKWPVKNAEYEVYVKQMRAAGKRIRVPYHWWRYGREDDYLEKLPEINKQFPKAGIHAPLFYWEQKGHELPYKLQDGNGKSIADHPVCYLTYSEAVAFAGWLGMRLATEAEWTRAARGDGTHVWPWGQSQPDVFAGDPTLKRMRLYTSADQKPQNVGTIEPATGPYGHVDMFGRIWQFISGVGYYALDREAFATEWKALQKDKIGSIVLAQPEWKDARVVAKGGSYLSGGEPLQLLIDSRLGLGLDETVEGIGLRLAKSLRPGYDLLFSLVRGVYNRGPFAPDQDVDLAGQVGAERYELGADGFPTAYHAVSVAPVNWLSAERNITLEKLLDRTHTTPLLIGSLALTEKLADPTVEPGLYSVLYRKAGMPRELDDAIKAGWKEVQAALKAKAKGGAAPAPEEAKPEEAKPQEGKADDKDKGNGKDEKNKKGDWRSVIARYGITVQDLEPKEAGRGLDFVRIDGVQVSTATAAFLLHGNDGKIVAAIPATNHEPAITRPSASTLVFEANSKGKAIAKFRFAVPLSAQDAKRVVDFHLHLTVDCAPPSATNAWRLPVAAAASPGAPAASANAAKEHKEERKEEGADAGKAGGSAGAGGEKIAPGRK